MKSVLAAAILTTIAASSFAQGKPVKPTDPATTAIASPTIADSTGKVVGLYQLPSYALFRFNGALIAIGLEPEGIPPNLHSERVQYSGQTAMFASSDCSGPAIPGFVTSVNSTVGAQTIAGTRAVAYVQRDGQVTAYIAVAGLPTAKSVVSFLSSGTCHLSSGSSTYPGYDVESTVILPPGPLTIR